MMSFHLRTLSRRLIRLLPLLSLLLITACAASGPPIAAVPPLSESPPTNVSPQTYTDWVYRWRSWRPEHAQAPAELQQRIGIQTPIQQARAKLLGPTVVDAQRSLALKLWLLKNARHTIDINYYIFSTDLVGLSILGALCDAVQRGVDVRVTVDSLGSISLGHTDLRALETCAEDAGFLHDSQERPTANRARVQVVIFNALTRFNFNRRSHDKLMLIDGMFPQHAVILTGGRNISLDYYGIDADGSADPSTFRDMEILLRPAANARPGSLHLGELTSRYYSVLFDYHGNRRIDPVGANDFDDESYLPVADTTAELYQQRRRVARSGLANLLVQPDIQRLMAEMPAWFDTGWRHPQVRLAHELDNLDNENVVDDAVDNKSHNPNSILNMMDEVAGEIRPGESLTIVSPYLFLARLTNPDGDVIYDEVRDILDWLERYPGSSLEIITNSVLTSDNFSTQAVIDMNTVPRLLLPPDLLKEWLSGWQTGDLNPGLVDSARWRELVNNPRIRIYEAGGADALALGGDMPYGKMHAKFIVGETYGWIGTSNLDYRSRLFNNEMGFFFTDQQLRQDLSDATTELKRHAQRWGSPEWLQLRRKVADAGGIKGYTTRHQRFIYKALIGLGLVWQF
jgi:phosphatidylserine/phosphatidylglycerophosphate/cardiolipin synthase-like enzyme